ncbi:MAG: flagellar basal body-associated FliL family protein, partial [Pseudorhodobacter sp.]
MGKILPVLLAVFGLAAGAGAGVLLRPPVTEEVEKTEQPPEVAPTETEFVKLNNQFIVPVLEHGRVSSMIIITLGLEVTTGGSEKIYAREPKVRDALLQVMFDHANAGGFQGVFTDESNLAQLRRAMREIVQKVVG